MIPTVKGPFLWIEIPIGSVQFPVHDPPAAWRRFTGEGGCAVIEVAPLPMFRATASILRFDSNLPLLEEISERKANG